ncbi:hypothetical protein F6X40_35295 [Paraburkholderia sp. UCT31]|uniref:hypothetical protein n=1 Tax=Paraburkholderia sp. UCT31 TaxID=2615209 RepID=UPI0016560B93|nr:hypothetical protein [Paraburkholderia sp. UCT31]MBC8741816.1 hypothetical protein [Paraburkholderia sp. UCT31]
MFVKVNPAVMARNVQEFVKQSGGNTTYCAALEMVSRMCGFDMYRALKVYAEGSKETDAVVFESTLESWDKHDELSLDAEKLSRRQTEYRVKVESFGSECLRVLVAPSGVSELADMAGLDVVDMRIEINEGIPCVHLTNDPNGEMLVTAFGHKGGMLLREDEGELDDLGLGNARLAEHINEEEWTMPYAPKAWAINNDTAEIYGVSAARAGDAS